MIDALLSIQEIIVTTVEAIDLMLKSCKKESDLPTAIRQCRDIIPNITSKSEKIFSLAQSESKTKKVIKYYKFAINRWNCTVVLF